MRIFLWKNFFIGVVVASFFLVACKKDETTQPPPGPTPHTIKGITLTPRSFQSADFTEFISNVKLTGELLSWAGDWIALVDTQNGQAAVVATLASTYGYTPIIEAQFFTQATGALVRPLNDSIKQLYKQSAVAFARKFKPKYLAFGIEVNMLFKKSQPSFNMFVPFYDEVYDAVKAVSPATNVFTIFQLEQMKGLDGGLFGGINDTSNAQWSLLAQFPKNDIIALTTYPGLIYKNPSKIPSTYYTEIIAHTTKPIAFTEVGWHSAASPASWESSDSEQAEFVTTFFTRSSALKAEFVIWSFMYDQQTIEPFNSMGLRRRTDGSVKPAWDAWVSAK